MRRFVFDPTLPYLSGSIYFTDELIIGFRILSCHLFIIVFDIVIVANRCRDFHFATVFYCLQQGI